MNKESTNKVYKRTIYWLNTNKCCGAVAVDQDGYIYFLDTAPCFRWMAEKHMTFRKALDFLRSKNYLWGCRKITEDVDPF